MNIDQDRYNALADWAESDKPEIHLEDAQSGPESQDATREMLRHAVGRPTIEPAPEPGAHAPRRQVRLPRTLSNRVDDLARRDNRGPSDLMREAITEYVAARDNQQA